MEAIVSAMLEYYRGDSQQIQHFIKVHSFARFIGQAELLEAETQRILEIAAIMHDIGIKPALAKYGTSSGTYQEQEGPPVARKMLSAFALPPDVVERVCYLVGNHHTYHDIDGVDYQILVEADFLVNMHEHAMTDEAMRSVVERIFKTPTGTRYTQTMFGLTSS